MCCMWQLHPSHLSVRVGDGSQCSEEFVQISNCILQCNYYYYYYYYYHHYYHSGHRQMHRPGLHEEIEVPLVPLVKTKIRIVCLSVGCFTSQQHASVSQGRICTDNFYMLPHWERSCRSNFLPHPVTVYRHPADQSQRWPYNARRLAG